MCSWSAYFTRLLKDSRVPWTFFGHIVRDENNSTGVVNMSWLIRKERVWNACPTVMFSEFLERTNGMWIKYFSNLIQGPFLNPAYVKSDFFE